LINIVIEIPLGSTDKIEWDSNTKEFAIDRQEPSNFLEPINYGFIPKTIGGDGDNLDAIIVQDSVISTGTIVDARIIGVMKFIDEGEVDDKIVAVSVVGGNDILQLSDLSETKIKEIEHYFSHYKDYKKPGGTSVLGWGGIEDAKKIITESIERYIE
jgi:inorganic pyrophosphatase